jgi:hypothetical protein
MFKLYYCFFTILIIDNPNRSVGYAQINARTIVGHSHPELAGMSSNEIGHALLDPEKAVDLRERYSSVLPGYHMNKTHWNTIHLEGGLPVKLVKSLIDHSYQLVVSALPVKDRQSLSNSNHHAQG